MLGESGRHVEAVAAGSIALRFAERRGAAGEHGRGSEAAAAEGWYARSWGWPSVFAPGPAVLYATGVAETLARSWAGAPQSALDRLTLRSITRVGGEAVETTAVPRSGEKHGQLFIPAALPPG